MEASGCMDEREEEAALAEAGRALAEATEALKGLQVSMCLYEEALQGEVQLKHQDILSFTWMTRSVLDASIEQLDEVAEALELATY